MVKKDKALTRKPIFGLHGVDLSNDPFIPEVEAEPILDPITPGTPITFTILYC